MHSANPKLCAVEMTRRGLFVLLLEGVSRGRHTAWPHGEIGRPEYDGLFVPTCCFAMGKITSQLCLIAVLN